ncbi:hypothetical protein BKA56DRAFT_724367 [Ilyonectria sp. MPI-CAGE-AT-0026]|nr:hypothetical protein BKA56DRAFT_724367 [Ilyonectria sp. MPI-CAGE-AT-0026]
MLLRKPTPAIDCHLQPTASRRLRETARFSFIIHRPSSTHKRYTRVHSIVMGLNTFLLALITGVVVAGIDIGQPFVKSQLLSRGIAIERKTRNSVLGKRSSNTARPDIIAHLSLETTVFQGTLASSPFVEQADDMAKGETIDDCGKAAGVGIQVVVDDVDVTTVSVTRTMTTVITLFSTLGTTTSADPELLIRQSTIEEVTTGYDVHIEVPTITETMALRIGSSETVRRGPSPALLQAVMMLIMFAW